MRLQQLAHKRRLLPEHAEIESLLNKDLTQLRDLPVAAQTEESDCAREQTKAEQDVDQVRQRAARDQKRLDGAVSSPKDLENLQREIVSLAKRQGDLEDIVLEVMECRESAQARVAELTERVASVQAKIDDATGRRDAAFEEIDGEAATVTKEREVVAGAVPADLLKLYEELREQQGGIGAAKLHPAAHPPGQRDTERRIGTDPALGQIRKAARGHRPDSAQILPYRIRRARPGRTSAPGHPALQQRHHLRGRRPRQRRHPGPASCHGASQRRGHRSTRG
ncbi:hypothetical protein SGLAM104S_07154 [Streptomyces glaucescens]